MSFAPRATQENKDPNLLPVFSGGLFNKDQITQWREILNAERAFAHEWEEKWGYFKAPPRLPRNPKARTAFLNGQARHEAAVAAGLGDKEAKKQMMEAKRIKEQGTEPMLLLNRSAMGSSAPVLPSAGNAVLSAQEKERAERTYINDRYRLMDQKRYMNPKQRYGRQLTSQHIHGWHRNLEIFGVGGNSKPCTGELVPDM